MAYTISKVGVWVGTIPDRPGGLAEKLTALAKSGANLEFVISRRDTPGAALLFVAPLKAGPQTRGAQKAGLRKAERMHSLRIVGPDRPGLGATITAAVAQSGINMRGFSAAAMNRKCLVYFAFDSAADTNKAAKVLQTLLNKR
jgi:predicted amino acid-binding ACT domain protein